MPDLFRNHIVGFPTRRLILGTVDSNLKNRRVPVCLVSHTCKLQS